MPFSSETATISPMPLRWADVESDPASCVIARYAPRCRCGHPSGPRQASSLYGLARPIHLARRRQRGRLAFDLGVGAPAEPAALDVVLLVALERGHVQRLQQLVVVGAHFDLAERRLHLKPLERMR